MRLAAATVVTQQTTLRPGAIEIDAGVIVAVEPFAGPAPDRVLTAGFVDLQVNGHDDIDVTAANRDDWVRLDSLLLRQGVTTWCPAVVTAPLDSYASVLNRITAGGAAMQASMAGVHFEGPFLGGAPGAHAREWIVPIDAEWLATLPASVKLITLAPELDGAVTATADLVGRGVVVSLGHSTATYDEARAAIDVGASLVTHLFNAMGPFGHRQPGLAGAALTDDRVSAAVIADGVHLHPAAVATAFRAKGASGVVLVTDAVAYKSETRRRRGIELRDGAPRLPDGTIAGSALTMDAAVRLAVTDCHVPLVDALTAASSTPARVLRLADRGDLMPGMRADVVALSPDLGVVDVWIAGEHVFSHP